MKRVFLDLTSKNHFPNNNDKEGGDLNSSDNAISKGPSTYHGQLFLSGSLHFQRNVTKKINILKNSSPPQIQVKKNNNQLTKMSFDTKRPNLSPYNNIIDNISSKSFMNDTKAIKAKMIRVGSWYQAAIKPIQKTSMKGFQIIKLQHLIHFNISYN